MAGGESTAAAGDASGGSVRRGISRPRGLRANAAREPYDAIGPRPLETSDGPRTLAEVLEAEIEALVRQPVDRGASEGGPAGEQERLARVYRSIHGLNPKRSALCLSGGGIRSASFGLGVIQGFAGHTVLEGFDYLSTVSGGGYVGGWLSAWMSREGRKAVIEKLKQPPPSSLTPEHEPIRHLRAFSNYLTPALGFFSADAWTLAATCLRNILLNWLVLLPWIPAVMTVPRLLVFSTFSRPWMWPYVPLWLPLSAGLGLVAAAMTYSVLDTPMSGSPGHSQSQFLLRRQLPLFLASLSLAWWWASFRNSYPEAERYYMAPSGIPWFVGVTMAAYLAGGVVGDVVLALRRDRGAIRSDSRTRPPAGRAVRRNAAVLVAAMFGGVALWAVPAYVFPDPAKQPVYYVCFAPCLILGVFLGINYVVAGLASWVSEDEDREWWGRSSAWLFINIVLWTALAGTVLLGPPVSSAVFEKVAPALGDPNWLLGAMGAVAGLVSAWSGFSPKTRAQREEQPRTWVLAPTTAAFFLLLTLTFARLLDADWDMFHDAANYYYPDTNPDQQAVRQALASLIGVMAMLSAGMALGLFIDVNKFSLHSVYRSRLIRAFLGASRPAGSRRPHLFTGFDPDDDLPMHELQSDKPLHIVGMTLNLAAGRQLAWTERKAASFTASRLHCGSWNVGYRSAKQYANGISLGTALAISGAAANPNMGYHSSPLVSFLMTLFNLRLGCWLGNPGSPGEHTWRRAGPWYSVKPLFLEALGHTTSEAPYVNLSDGGHFDNLGLYEMVLRRCHHIVVVDAGQDASLAFGDLGKAIRQIRIDLGIPIEISFTAPLEPGTGAGAGKASFPRCALGKVCYSARDGPGTDGWLLYLKPQVLGDEPADVRSYKATHPEFPHETTADQWFGESQLESYRMLGLHTVERVCGEAWRGSVADLFDEVK